MSLFIFLATLYYLLKDGEKIKKFIIELSPLRDRNDEAILKKLEGAANSIVKGNLLIALTQGVLTAAGLWVFGVPNAALWGSVTVITAIIPGVGTALVLAPAIAFLFFSGATASGFGLLAWGVGAVGLVDNFLGPRLVGRGMQLHPLIILLSVLGGIAFFGPVGLIMGPLTVSFLFALFEVYFSLAKERRG
jgi:predicted PurR-regulated permease PerM